MERNYDEVIADMLIQLDKHAALLEKIETRIDKGEKRMDLAIKRLVKSENRMEIFDKRLEQSLIDQKEFSNTQSKLNKFFIDYIERNSPTT
jgi:hypothetical protein